MAKIKVRSGRGTKIIEVDDNATKWAGSEFKKIQEARKEASKDKYVTVGRGTGKIKFGAIPTTAHLSQQKVCGSVQEEVPKRGNSEKLCKCTKKIKYNVLYSKLEYQCNLYK